MKKLTFNIEPLEGFGELKFGMAPAAVTGLLGNPDEEEILETDDDEETNTLIMHFDEQDISLFFEGDENERYLVNIETGNSEAKLFETDVFKLSEEEIIELMKSKGFEDMDVEDAEDEEFPDDRRISFDDVMMDFFFENGELASVSWGNFLDDEESDAE
jgi:hypothetical protein